MIRKKALALILGAVFWVGVSAPLQAEEDKSFEHIETTAQEGNAASQFQLGMMYYLGGSVPRDSQSALYWLLKSAEQGYTDSYYFIGNMYYDGVGVKQDYKKAISWYRKSSGKGDKRASLQLANMYYDGQELKQDYYSAMLLYQVASFSKMEEISSVANYMLGKIYFNGLGVEENRRYALGKFMRAAYLGHPRAQTELGLMYRDGEVVPQNYMTAVSLYQRAARQGEPHAQMFLGSAYALGEGIRKDYKMAYVWSSVAYANGVKEALVTRDIAIKHLSSAELAEGQKLAARYFGEFK